MPTPQNYWEQPERTEIRSDGSGSITKTYKGDFAALKTFAAGLSFNTTAEEGLPLRNINLTRTVGSPNLAVLRLEFGEDVSYSEQKTATVKSENWTMKHTQRIVPLMRHTGESASMPRRGNLEAWSREPDPALYDAWQYRNQAGVVMTLSPSEIAIARKLAAGVDGAMRFYPTVQKVTVYTGGTIADVGLLLAHISTPGSPWDSVAASWLKVGDDVTMDAKAGTQTRTESWIGAASWDENLYGETPDRWTELD